MCAQRTTALNSSETTSPTLNTFNKYIVMLPTLKSSTDKSRLTKISSLDPSQPSPTATSLSVMSPMYPRKNSMTIAKSSTEYA